MNLENIILKEYNLNIININYILTNKIEIDICNFIYSNNLSLSIKSIDTKKIILHFLIQGILNYSKTEYNNIILQKDSYKTTHINFLSDEENCSNLMQKLLFGIAKKMKLPLISISQQETIDKDFILKMKSLVENKPKNIIQTMDKFLKGNGLKKLSSDLKINPNMKFKLHKI